MLEGRLKTGRARIWLHPGGGERVCVHVRVSELKSKVEKGILGHKRKLEPFHACL